MKRNNILKVIHNSNYMKRLRKFTRNFFCVLSFLIALKTFTYKEPYFIVLGFMLLAIFILLFPYTDKLLAKMNLKLTIYQKWFIGVFSFLTAAYSIKVDTKEYYRSIISILIIIIIWVAVIMYSKRKDKKLKK